MMFVSVYYVIMSQSDSDGGSDATSDGGMNRAGPTRRGFLKASSGVAAAGALGSLAGCIGGTDETPETETTGDAPGDSASQEGITIRYLSAQAVENADTQQHFQESMGIFEEKNQNVTVNLQTASYSDIRQTLASTVSGGNPPDYAEAGAGGLEWFDQGIIPDHGPFVESTDGLPDDWTAANQDAARFRGQYWSGGALRHTSSNLGIRPKHFSQVGIEDPFEDLQTWTQFYDALEKIDQQIDGTYAYEETGVGGDLESYWGYARTAYTEGTDPWIRGDPENPDVIVANEDHEDRPATDGMIKNCLHLADRFSSPEAAQRGDEEIPALMLTDRVSSFMYATPTANRWRAVTEDIRIGWHGGEGDFMLLPDPRLDAEYGARAGISDLEGLEGQHGGHVWALEQMHTLFDTGEEKNNAAWDLNMFLLSDPEFVLPMWGEFYEAIPGLAPMSQQVLDEYDLAQNTSQAYKNLEEYGSQYAVTGAAWDLLPTDQIRWTDINETISEAIAGQHSPEETPGLVRERIMNTLGN